MDTKKVRKIFFDYFKNKNHKIIDDYTHISKQKNPLCGDEMEISLKVSNEKIADFAYQCKSCIYCQASASLLSKSIINKSIQSVNEIIKLIDNNPEMFMAYINRHLHEGFLLLYMMHCLK